ncbi:MAG: hypothetical protein AB1499_10020 [Nitrospirota bacterium]
MKKISFIILTAALIMISKNVYCNEFQGSVHVSAHVIAAAKYEILHQENSYTVTPEDIDKGYIDIAHALSYSVWTNSHNGYLMTFAFNNRQLEKINLIDKHNSYIISNEYEEIHMPHQGMKYETKELSLRLYLSADSKPGIYPIPLAFAISAL